MEREAGASNLPGGVANADTYNVLVFREMPTPHPVVSELNRRGFLTMSVSRREEAVSAVEAFSPDAMLLNLRGEGALEPELIEGIKARDPHLPVVVIAERTSPEHRADALRVGADDYVAPLDVPATFVRELESRILSSRKRREWVFEQERGAVTRFAEAMCRRLEEPVAEIEFHCRSIQIKDDFPKDLRANLGQIRKNVTSLANLVQRLRWFGSRGRGARKIATRVASIVWPRTG